MHEYDNRFLWMNLKAHHRLSLRQLPGVLRGQSPIDKGMIHPTLSKTFSLEDAGQAAYEVHTNAHQGKVGVPHWRPRRGSACATRRSGRSSSTRSTASRNT